jgi:Ribbon-helix-helix protein, copG family
MHIYSFLYLPSVSHRLYRTTILVDKELWKRFKIRAIEEGKSASALLEELISEALKKPLR